MPALLNATSTLPYVSVRLRDHRLDLLRVGDVAAHVQPADLLGRRAAALVVDVDDDDLGALLGEPAGGREPDAAPAAGDDRGAVLPAVQPSGQSSVLMKTFLTSVNESRASGPSSRPRPDCLNPPNGVE